MSSSDTTTASSSSYSLASPPWTLHGDVYTFAWHTSASRASADGLPSHAYSPLEAASDYAAHPVSRFVGGLATVQIIRYRDSPVGPYDELIVIPGHFQWARPGDESPGQMVTGANPKISRIYVSQPHTCHNGRINWNVPKHLARFDWSTSPDGTTTIKVYPHDIHPHTTTTTAHTSESTIPPDSPPSQTAAPFFQASFRPIRFLPSFPFSTDWARFFGVDTTLIHPPLPEGRGSLNELPGTDKWCSVKPGQSSRNCALGWFDISQQKSDGQPSTGQGGAGAGAGGVDDQGASKYENFWPKLGRWQIGIKMDNAVITFGDPEHRWHLPKANL
jgi:hypothetical protein